MVRDGAVVIDVGVNRDPETGKLCGDVDFAAIEPEGVGHHPCSRRRGADDDLLPDGEYDRVLPAAYRAEIAPNRLPRTLFASGALPRKTRSENFGFFSALPFPGLRRWEGGGFLRPASSNACPAFCRVRAPLMSIFRMLVYRYAHGLYMKARIGIQKCFLCRLIRFIWCNDAVFI